MGTTRRQFLAAASATALATAVPAAEGAPTNLLFLITDQHKFDVLGCMGNPLVRTPNLDRLASQGVLFTQAHSTVPYCSPTRTAMITGRYPSTLGVSRNVQGKVNGKPDPIRLVDPLQTYMHILKERGYACHNLGKWHLGNLGELSCFADPKGDGQDANTLLHKRRAEAGGDAFSPQREGETLDGFTYMTPNTARCHAIWKDEPKRTKQDLSFIGRHRFKAEHQYEYVLADQCIDLIRKHHEAERPFAITYSVSPPHAFWVAPSPYYDWYDPAAFKLPANATDKPKAYAGSQAYRLSELFGPEGMAEYLRCYYAQVSMVDAYMGRILDELDKLGIADNTLVIFTSDHGDMNGGHGLMDKTVDTCYEEIIRVPLIMRLPGATKAGATTDVQADSTDLAPTILDLLAAKPLDQCHGRSLRPFLAGAPDDGQPAFVERGDPANKSCRRMIRTPEWKLIMAGNANHQLFDLAKDPGETRNLYDVPAHAATQARLRTALKQHMETLADPALAGPLKQYLV
jgi:arylsulfatase A-like enzyme